MDLEEKYWKENYADPSTMDCIGNVNEHLSYIKAFLKLELIDVSSIVDLGFGPGILFSEVVKEFRPYRVLGVEPSKYIYKQFDDAILRKYASKVSLKNQDILTWSRSGGRKLTFDLGICTSVFQYIENDELEEIVINLSKKVKYLYLTVPTDKELGRQLSEIEFHDKYAIRRSKTKYWNILSKGFTCVSARFLESKHFFNEKNTLFSDLLYRF